MPSARLIVERPRGRQFARLRAFKIVIDGVQRGRVGYGDVSHVDLVPGRHTAKVVVDWLSSPPLEFDLHEGQEKHLTCVPTKLGSGIAFPPVLWVRLISRRNEFLELREM